MWLLVLIMFSPTWGEFVLEVYPTEDDCVTAKKRVAEDMALAYPDDHTYEVDCKPIPAKL